MTVAAPRIGRFHFLAPDNYPIIKSAEKRPIVFFQSGGRIVFGIFMRAMTFWEAGHGPNSSETEFNPEATVRVRLDEFLSQPVLCFRGQWLSRRAVVKYAANVASGVHSNTPTTDVDRALARMRHAITFRRSDQGRIELIVNTDAMRQVDANTDRPFAYDPNAIDVVLIELLAAAHFVECSDDTARLEAAIRAELHLPAPQP